MTKVFTILGICWLPLAGLAPAANPTMPGVVGRTVYHPDKSRTESVSDLTTRELTETTYDPNNVLTVRKHYLLNEKGEPLQGNIYDGKGNLVARSVSIYDQFQRRVEDRLTNLNGEIFQRVIHEYGADGKPKKPKVVNLNVKAPTLRPASLDFTQQAAAANTAPAAGPAAAPSTDRFAPTVVPSGTLPDASGNLPPIYAPGAAPAGAAPQAEPPKKSFFKRLFEKKEK